MTVEEQIAELEKLTFPELVAMYVELHGKRPRRHRREWVLKRCAWKIQERAYGGLSKVAKERLESLIAELDLPFGKEEKSRQGANDGALRPGMTVSREWCGKDIQVQVLDDGFEWNGERYKSLSGVAKAITGSHVSGPRWFGLKRPKVTC